jgi:hypothetical protein
MYLLKVADDMRKHNEPTDPRAARELRSVYFFALRDQALVQRLVAALPIADHVATIKAIQDVSPADVSLTVMTAVLQEAGGQRAEAIETWRAVRATQPAKSNSELAKRADTALKRI